jgi:hypothetical protein
MMPEMDKARAVVEGLGEVLSLVAPSLSEDQRRDIRTFIDVGEWALAVETLCDLLYEDELPVPARAYALLQEIGDLMGLEPRTWELLEPQVLQ